MALNNTVLYDYQKRWLNDKSRFKVAMFARQTGKTFTTTLEIVLDCLEAEANGERTRWVILSRGERQAKEAMNEDTIRHNKFYFINVS
ncbi:terminase large subunit domain-containing protein, partial [Glaesserella parasuis]|uniref:terminase large subunit domain-containing protein n=1 Tax=Glaesserella parasuis TaxID=738 RepID=UPI0005521E7A